MFKEATTYRSKMKGYCEGLVMLHYATALGLEPTERFDSKGAKERTVSERVRNLIGDDATTFHYGPNDELVGFFVILMTRFLHKIRAKEVISCMNALHKCASTSIMVPQEEVLSSPAAFLRISNTRCLSMRLPLLLPA